MRIPTADLQRIEKTLAPHVCRPRNARAFDFRSPGSSAYAYSLTWTPGSISLAGDCGELTICHYNALWDLKEGLQWAARSDLYYLLDKTKLRPTFDADATIKEILRTCNEPALDSLKALRNEMRQWRSERPDPYAWNEPYECDYVDWLNDRPADHCHWRSYVSERTRYDYRSEEERTHIADGWEIWDGLRKALGLYQIDAPHRSAQRKLMAEILEEEIRTAHDAYELCYSKLGWDDYRPEYEWTFHDLLQVECIRRGARLALEQLDADPPVPAYAWRPALADDMAAFPSAFRERFNDILARAA